MDINGELSAAIRCNSNEDVRPQIYGSIKKKDWVLLELKQEKRTFEELFRELTKEN
jgi:hypothetical protein